jgi:processive 1,2-diacylglycerol beta-glucosyltransferase
MMGTREFGVPMCAVGGLVSPTFEQEQTAAQRIATRQAVGLPMDGRVVLLVAGSEGMGEVIPTVDAIVESGVADVLVLCGRNERLRLQLSGRDRVVALGWRSDVATLMAASDVLVHNAGGLSLTEALTAGLPAVTFRPIPAHGRANAELLARAGLVPWPQDDAELAAAIVTQCEAGRQDRRVVLRHQDASQLVRSLVGRGKLESLLSSAEYPRTRQLATWSWLRPITLPRRTPRYLKLTVFNTRRGHRTRSADAVRDDLRQASHR